MYPAAVAGSLPWLNRFGLRAISTSPVTGSTCVVPSSVNAGSVTTGTTSLLLSTYSTVLAGWPPALMMAVSAAVVWEAILSEGEMSAHARPVRPDELRRLERLWRRLTRQPRPYSTDTSLF